MSALAVRKEDVDQLPYYVGKRVENIPKELKAAWEAKDYNTVLLHSLGHDKEIEDLSRKFGASEEGIISDYAVKFNIQIDKVAIRAAQQGEINILKVCKEQSNDLDLNVLLFWAAMAGHVDTFFLIIKWGATDFDDPMISTNYVNIIKFCKECGATDFDSLAWSAAERGNEEILRLSEEWGATEFDDPLLRAVQFHHRNAAFLCKEFGAVIYDEALVNAAESGDVIAFQLAIDLGASDFNYTLKTAYDYGRANNITKCVEHGADNYLRIIGSRNPFVDDEGEFVNPFFELGRSSLMLVCDYENISNKMLFRRVTMFEQIDLEINAISEFWNDMVSSCERSRPLDFNRPPKITVTYDNKFVVTFSLGDHECEDVAEMIRLAFNFNRRYNS